MNIEIRNLNKSFGEKHVIKNYSVVFPEGEISCIMGPSGCGKTTLLNILMGLYEPDKINGGTIIGMPKKIAAVFQEDRLCEDFSAVANVKMAAPGLSSKGAEQLLCELGLWDENFYNPDETNKRRAGKAHKDLISAPVRTMSGGMRRRVAIARALAADSDVLILDEPFKGLDDSTKLKVIQVILKYCHSDTVRKTVIMVTHSSDEALLMGAAIYKFA